MGGPALIFNDSSKTWCLLYKACKQNFPNATFTGVSKNTYVLRDTHQNALIN